ncbi:MAG: hypothetical protein GBAus27B_000278 [Mycoplasmataceae bacterium]|nr:MAG: hypothetical protein GBAus27B_000278 [Mycoplasmataceae bacterium]
MTTNPTNGHLKIKDSQGEKKKSFELILGKYSFTLGCLTLIAITIINKLPF